MPSRRKPRATKRGQGKVADVSDHSDSEASLPSSMGSSTGATSPRGSVSTRHSSSDQESAQVSSSSGDVAATLDRRGEDKESERREEIREAVWKRLASLWASLDKSVFTTLSWGEVVGFCCGSGENDRTSTSETEKGMVSMQSQGTLGLFSKEDAREFDRRKDMVMARRRHEGGGRPYGMMDDDRGGGTRESMDDDEGGDEDEDDGDGNLASGRYNSSDQRQSSVLGRKRKTPVMSESDLVHDLTMEVLERIDRANPLNDGIRRVLQVYTTHQEYLLQCDNVMSLLQQHKSSLHCK